MKERSGQGRASGRGGVLRSGRGEAEIWSRRGGDLVEAVCSDLVEAVRV